MNSSPPDPADFVIRRKYRLFDLAISLGTCGLFVLLVGPLAGLMWFAIILLHEFGHFALGFRFTGRAPAIVVYPLLGLTLAPGMSRRPTRENIAFALGGVWLSLAMALLLLPFFRMSDHVLAFLGFCLALNLINVLPIPGLDGGRVCQMIASGLPHPWPRVAGIAMFGFAFAFAGWLNDPVLWVILLLVTVITVAMLVRGVRWKFVPLAPAEAFAWFGVYVLTLTVLAHLLWVVLSEKNSLFRIFMGLGLADR